MYWLLYQSNPWLLPIVMLVVLGFAIEGPARYGQRLVAKVQVDNDGWNVIQGGILTLVAFMLGISFSQSQARFDSRRELVVKEANAIGTTWLRADQLALADSERFRTVLRDYTSLRLEAYRGNVSREELARAQAQSDAAQGQLWILASSGLRAQPQNLGRSLLMETLNDTIDVSAEELQALTHHVPTVIMAMTVGLVVLGALIMGLSFARTGKPPRVLAVAYALSTVIVLSMMLDLDRPQTGFVHVNLDPLVVQLNSMR